MQRVDDKIGAFLDRPLEGDWPYLWLDATYVKVRQRDVAALRSSGPSSRSALVTLTRHAL